MDFFRILILEVWAALLRALFLPVVFLVATLFRLLRLLVRLWRARSFYPEESDDGCPPIPEALVRRPDPCIYSQKLLLEQGLPVTWNNPDIWIAPAADPAAVMPDSYHLTEDTDYLVTVRVHNASTDAALGVRVRLRHRSWGFNVPDLRPVETDGAGQEVSRFVDVAPMGSSLTVFHWHTDALPPGEVKHYCLQASLEHPLDVNPANNVGQENTNVYAANPGHVTPGEVVDVTIPLFNPDRFRQAVRFEATMYRVDHARRHVLRLDPNPGYRRWHLDERIANIVPTLHPHPPPTKPGDEGPSMRSVRSSTGGYRFSLRAQRPLVAVRTRYVGFVPVRERLRGLDVALPGGMQVRAEGRPLEEGLELEGRDTVGVRFTLTVPVGAGPGAVFPINLVAKKANGVLIGGVTLLLRVKE